MTLINTGGTTLTGSSVTIGSIPSTYVNLQLIIRNPKTATDAMPIYMRFNGDSSSRYNESNVYGTSLNRSFSSTSLLISQEQDNGTDNGLIIVDIYDYANTATWKMARSFSITNNGTTTTNLNQWVGTNYYNQTGAITSIDIKPDSGNFTSGTAYLYGVK
jgi:hypothetical protein